MLVEEKVSRNSTVLCIWHVFHNFISNVIRKYALLYISKLREDGYYREFKRDGDLILDHCLLLVDQ